MDNVIKVIRYYSMENEAYYLKVTHNDKFITSFMPDEIEKAKKFAEVFSERLKDRIKDETILTITV